MNAVGRWLVRAKRALAGALKGEQSQGRRLFWFVVALVSWAAVMAVPTPEALGHEGQLAVALVVAACVLFGSEALPLPAIGLLIPVYQVVVGGMSTESVTNNMMSNAVLFLMGTLMLVAALTSRGVDKLIALFILTRTGTNIYSVTFGIVAASALLAGFMSDAAAALMLAPVLGIVSIVNENREVPATNLTKLLIFAVGFGAIVGSPYTPAGGARNVIMLDYMAELGGENVSFLEWILYLAPFTVLMIGVVTFLLPRFFPPETTDLKAAVASLRVEVEERPVDRDQYLVIAVFAVTIVLWLMVGDLFGIGIIAIGAAALLLALNSVTWQEYQKNVDWGVLVIYLGAISLGGYMAYTGAAQWVAQSFTEVSLALGVEGGNSMVMLVSTLVTAMTSSMSAGATASVMGPIVIEISAQTGIPVIVMGLSTALASSFGFMLVVSTPGNAIIYSSGYVRASDFIKVGFFAMIAAFGVFYLLLRLYWPWLTG